MSFRDREGITNMHTRMAFFFFFFLGCFAILVMKIPFSGGGIAGRALVISSVRKSKPAIELQLIGKQVP